jgi:hypothetical protein
MVGGGGGVRETMFFRQKKIESSKKIFERTKQAQETRQKTSMKNEEWK